MSIRAQFVLVLSLILSGGVGTTGTLLILRHARHDRTLLAEKQMLLVEHAAFALQGNLAVAARELSRLAKLPELDPGDNDPLPERQLLYSAHENSVFFREVRILDENGRVTLTQPAGEGMGASFADRRWFAEAKVARSPFFYAAPEGAPVPDAVAVVVPLRHEGRFSGAIQGLLALADDKVLTPELRHTAGPRGEFIVVDHEGHAVFPPGATPTLVSDGWGYVVGELAGSRAGSRHVTDASGDFMYACAPVGIGGWGVAMRWPWAALNADTREQVWTTAAILVVGTLVVALLGILFSAYLTRPLERLGGFATRIAQGHPGVTEEERATLGARKDEIGALWRAFAQMEKDLGARDQRIREDLETITRLNAGLEERVRERTRELEAAQVKLVDAERFAAMGKTAAAIAHEMRNALNGLGMCVDLVLADTPAVSGTMRVRAQIHQEIARLRDVTESLLTFSRTPRLELAPTDVHELIARALDVLSEPITEGGVHVELALYEGGAPFLARVDGHKVQGALINLVKNAVEAMTTRPLDLKSEGDAQPAILHERRLRIATAADGEWVRITIADSGPGIEPRARAQLFEPFFTTKVTGTGLGLATARRVVEAHGGTIVVEEGAGAIFVLRVPRVVDA